MNDIKKLLILCNKSLNKNGVIFISNLDTYKNEFSPNYRLKYTNKYIQNNYENIYEEDVWVIKKRIN